MRIRQGTPARIVSTAISVSAISLLFAGCTSFLGKASPGDPVDDLRVAIRETVPDDNRRNRLLGLTDEWAEVLDDLAAVALQRSELKKRIIEIHLAMKASTTEQEWTSLEKATQTMTMSTVRLDLPSAGGAL